MFVFGKDIIKFFLMAKEAIGFESHAIWRMFEKFSAL